MDETDRSATDGEAAPRRGMGAKAWIGTLAAAAVLGGGAFYAAFTGVGDSLVGGGKAEASVAAAGSEAPRYLELDPMTVTVGGGGTLRQLRFRAFLELGAQDDAAIAALQPRILDIFATYLRAVPADRLEEPTALLHLRAQLLRRVQLLAGAGAVNDLLIIDFVIV